VPCGWQRIPVEMTVPVAAAAAESRRKREKQEREAEVCLLEVFASLPDSRRRRGVRHPQDATLALVVVGLLAGCKNSSQIFMFGKTHGELLKRLGFRPPKQVRRKERRGRISAPNEDTIAAILNRVSSEELNERFTVFLSRMVTRGAVAAIDGKALRGTKDYVLSVFVNEICQVVWQEDVGTKENELATLERALGEILKKYPQIKVFTGDAAFCHKSIARKLIRAKRDYFLQLKSPHKTDVALAEDTFRQLRAGRAPGAVSEEKRAARGGRNAPSGLRAHDARIPDGCPSRGRRGPLLPEQPETHIAARRPGRTAGPGAPPLGNRKRSASQERSQHGRRRAALQERSVHDSAPAKSDGGIAAVHRGRFHPAQANRRAGQSGHRPAPADAKNLPEDQRKGLLGVPGFCPPSYGPYLALL
jgi:hypothetical protein